MRARRAVHEMGRRASGRDHEVTWYHRVDDPHSHLLAQALPAFLERFDVKLVAKTVPHPDEGAISAPSTWATWAAADVASVAPFLGLVSPGDARPDPGPATARLQAAEGGDYLGTAIEVGDGYFRGLDLGNGEPDQARLRQNAEHLISNGHYLSGMLHYAGEWYWGVDRLGLLEDRLAELGLGEGHSLHYDHEVDLPPIEADELEMWVSMRSPYSYLAFDRVVALAEELDIRLSVHVVLPMVMRGIPAPRAKRLYILDDVARLARKQGVPFGWLVDPLPAVERVIAAAWVARRHDREVALISAALRGMWAEGVDASTDQGLNRIVAQAGVSLSDVLEAIEVGEWRQSAEAGRKSLGGAGLWGVPSFRYGDFVTWGQDRVWLLEKTLRAAQKGRNESV